MGMETTAAQKNETKLYYRNPDKMMNRGFSATVKRVYSAIYTFSQIPNVPTARCRMTYDDFCRNLHISRPSVAKAIRQLSQSNYIKNDGKNQKSASYYAVGGIKKSYTVTPEELLGIEFTDKNGVSRPLTKTEVRLLSTIYTHGGENKGYTASYTVFSNQLNISYETARHAIYALRRFNLIHCPDEDKGDSFKKHSRYTVNREWYKKLYAGLKKQKKADESAKKFVSEEVKAANARADREQYYSRLRETAQRHADLNARKVGNDPAYARANIALRKLGIAIKNADYAGNQALLNELRQTEKLLNNIKKSRLALVGLIPEDLQPRYKCQKCSDTGFLPSGVMCDCYRRE